jgi:hypothetical protein
LYLCSSISKDETYETRYRFKNKPVTDLLGVFGFVCFVEPTGLPIVGSSTLSVPASQKNSEKEKSRSASIKSYAYRR